MIKKLEQKDAALSLEIIKGVTTKMRNMGIDQWDEHYPTLNDVTSDIIKGNAYGYFEKNTLAGYVIFNTEFDIEYNDIQWLNTNNDFLIMHRLSVHPSFQGKGIAKKLIAFGEKLAIQLQLSSLRFDAYTENPISNAIYEKMGFENRGTVVFRKGVFNCYEKLLS